MATKKKANKRSKVKRTAGKKAMPMKKLAKKKGIAKKRLSNKKPVPTKMAVKTKAVDKKTASGLDKKVRESQSVNMATFPPERPGPRSGGQSGDLQGLSNVESADSQSVDELIEEGNASEAGVVAGVEDAGDHDEREVSTREVSEDDVPSEYLDKE